ncbi:MAG: 6-carboxytetrahydropterin synthase QueD [Chlamydiales bacterium]|nr:6-carboxytetrahydropterin synthase QueD [Chlamydiales bacterium]
MSFTLEKTFRFEAGHILSHHDGKCRFPHGHSYVLTIRIRSDQLQSSGPKKNMVIDFSDLSTVAGEMINNYFDHHWLNDTLETDAPTVEYIAKWIFDYLHPKLPNLHSVTLHETATSSVTYSQ